MKSPEAIKPGQDWRNRSTITVEDTVPILGISRSSAYEAARTGEIPTLRIGRRMVVPVAALRRLLGEILPANDVEPSGQPGSTQNGVSAPHAQS